MEPETKPQESAGQPIPQPGNQPVLISSIPKQLKWFELLMYLSIGIPIILGIIGSFFAFNTLGLTGIILSSLYGLPLILVKPILVFLTVRKRMNWARITLTVLVASEIFGSISGLIFSGYLNTYIFSSIIVSIFQVKLISLTFSSASNQWFNRKNSSAKTGDLMISKIWQKRIPIINIVFTAVSLLLVFGLDLVILISSPSLAPFWIEMLIVFAVFMIFVYLENVVFKKRYSQSSSNLDTPIIVLVIFRNIVFVLNFIPLIQAIGAQMAISGIIPYVIVYSILVSKRGKALVN